MRESNHDGRWQARTGATAPTNNVVPQDGTAEQRRKMRQGLCLLAKIIAHAHLRRQGEQRRAAPHGPPHGEWTAEPPTKGKCHDWQLRRRLEEASGAECLLQPQCERNPKGVSRATIGSEGKEIPG